MVKPHYIIKTKTKYRSIQYYSTNLGGRTFSEEEIGETTFFSLALDMIAEYGVVSLLTAFMYVSHI